MAQLMNCHSGRKVRSPSPICELGAKEETRSQVATAMQEFCSYICSCGENKQTIIFGSPYLPNLPQNGEFSAFERCNPQCILSWNFTGEIRHIGRHRAETHRYFNIRFFGQMPPDASDSPGGIPALKCYRSQVLLKHRFHPNGC